MVIPFWHDLTVVEQSLERGSRLLESGQQEQGWGEFQLAVSLYDGPYLENCYLDWAVRIRHRVEARMVEALAELGQWHLQSARPAEALELAERAIGLDDCCQEAHGVAMRVHLEAGEPELVIRYYERCRESLRLELGLEPSDEIEELYGKALG